MRQVLVPGPNLMPLELSVRCVAEQLQLEVACALTDAEVLKKAVA